MKPSLKLLVPLFSVFVCLQATATTRYVSTTGDDTNNDCTDSLNACGTITHAIGQSNPGDTVQVAAGTYMEHGITVDKDLTISGHSASDTIVQAAAAQASATDRVFYINSGKTVTISGLTIRNGRANGGTFPSSSGGGIFNDHANLTLSGSTVAGNSASGVGGGITNDGGTLMLTDSTLSGNSDAGIFNSGLSGSAMLTIKNSTLSGNSNSDSPGGGIYNNGVSGSVTLTITNSTFSGNSAQLGGGGIFNDGHNGSAALTISNSTFSGNSAQDGAGGAIHSFVGLVTIGNTILNAGASGANILNDTGTVTSNGYNLSSDMGVTNINEAPAL